MIQSCLVLILVVFIIFMMIQITRLQGTARVINYAGLVLGMTGACGLLLLVSVLSSVAAVTP